MWFAKRKLIFVTIIALYTLTIQTAVLGQESSANSIDIQKTLKLLEESQSQQKRLLETLSDQLVKSKTSWLQVFTLIVSILIALGGWIFAAYQASKNLKEAARRHELDLEEAKLSRLEEHLFNSLEFFSGKTQRRSIGIAVVSANWDQFDHLRPTWVSILVSQAIYLLTESKSHDKTHELQNVKDIIGILLKSNAQINVGDKSDLIAAIQTNRKNKPDQKKNGLKIIESHDLDLWEKALK